MLYSEFMTDVNSHESYLLEIPPLARSALDQLRTAIRRAAPEAIETISSNVPAYQYKGKYLASMTAAKDHVSFFMMRGDVLKKMRPELTDYTVTNVAIKYDPVHPLPDKLVEKLIKMRVEEIERNQNE